MGLCVCARVLAFGFESFFFLGGGGLTREQKDEHHLGGSNPFFGARADTHTQTHMDVLVICLWCTLVAQWQAHLPQLCLFFQLATYIQEILKTNFFWEDSWRKKEIAAIAP